MMAGADQRRRIGSTAGRYAPRRAFTLLEAVLALFLMIIMLSGVYGFYVTSLRVRDEGGRITRDVMLVRVLLDQMAREIRHATSVMPGDGIGFQGYRDRITVVYAGMPERYVFNQYDPVRDILPPAQMDMRRVTYELLWDTEYEDDEGVSICHGLWRSEQKTFDPNPMFVIEDKRPSAEGEEEESRIKGPRAEGELIAPEIKYLKFEYFDGAEWQDLWQVIDEKAEDEFGEEVEGEDTAGDLAAAEDPRAQAGYALPQAVRITIGKVRVDPEQRDEIEDEEKEEEVHHPDRFTIVVYLLQADQTLLSSRKYGVADQIGRQEKH